MDIFRTSVGSATLFFLRGHFEEKIQAQEKENDVRRPPRQKRWKLAKPDHGFQKLGDRTINVSKTKSDRHTTHRAARLPQNHDLYLTKHSVLITYAYDRICRPLSLHNCVAIC